MPKGKDKKEIARAGKSFAEPGINNCNKKPARPDATEVGHIADKVYPAEGVKVKNDWIGKIVQLRILKTKLPKSTAVSPRRICKTFCFKIAIHPILTQKFPI